MAKMQPSIDQMQRQAAEIQKEFSDPAKVKAMQEQARALQRSLQEQQKAKAAGKTARADDLEKELGL
jgi:predicted RNA-binding Zn ribbon-like protein